MSQNIGFISTRFAGTDGVSLEALKWARVLEDQGHRCFWYAGKTDHPPAVSHGTPEAFFDHPANQAINREIWGRPQRTRDVTNSIHDLTAHLKTSLYAFVERFNIQILVLQNVLAIPMHIPLGLAITELMAETGIPSIGHHHDFYWERTRFSVNGVSDYLDMAFPPRAPNLQHVVINAEAQEALAHRRGVSSLVIPNVLDFESPPQPPDDYSRDLRADLGFAPDDILFLQPTRVVPRKGIGHAINLVQMLHNPKCKLLVSHEAGDEGLEYRDMLAGFAQRSGVDLRFVATRVSEQRQLASDGRKTYTLADLYPHADFVTYPSLYEGFGNAFLEAIYFKKPILVNRYGVFSRDIEPKGFRVPIIEGYLTAEIVAEVRKILTDAAHRTPMVEHNSGVAARHYSYAVLRRALRTLTTNILGLDM